MDKRLGIKSLLKYSMIKYIALMFAFIQNYMNAKVLGPDVFGILGNFLLILMYLTYGNLGILFAFQREYPLSDDHRRKKILENINLFLIVISLIMILIGISITIINYNSTDSKYNFTYLLIFLIAICDQYINYFTNYFRVIDEITSINIIESLSKIGSFFIIAICIFLFHMGLNGVLIGMLISRALAVVVTLKKVKVKTLSLDKEILSSLFQVGIPLLIYNLGFYIFSTVDRWIIIKYFTDKDLGYYTFADQMSTATFVFVNSILFLYYPKAIRLFNLNLEETHKIKIDNTIREYTKKTEVFCVILMLIGIICIDPFVYVFLDKYIATINIYKILIIGTMLGNISYFFNVCLVSNRKQNWLVIIQGFSIILILVFNIGLMRYGLIGIAIATLIVKLIYSITQCYLSSRYLELSNPLHLIFQVYSKVMLLSVTLIIINLGIDGSFVKIVLSILVTSILYSKDIIKVSKDTLRDRKVTH